ncbi:ribosome biogenesis factor YjgA [Larsenimonas rhizosphaerae]|uniref:Dual-action ribosomal maturation protein DarP n=1 Tax=Larsenimonas rhizosphaerae TaxID=2944682 RepID=A0AA41ZEI2_9GAMM|nr:ribosome biogenesis factor YjgA [Larsenimonas rhizosphaerae]MCM2131089.1 DUF615 domain-containing protein [Larsenimonas rhizosphaerae]MCX2523794.1 DUF615 domain-containing protein [Larsenimonas rhizosphaerae]
MSSKFSPDHDEYQSKTQRKHAMEAMQALGQRILDLPRDQQRLVPLSDDMLAAIEEMDRISSREARRRHMQYIGKVMRNEDLPAIEACFAEFDRQRLARDRGFHRLEEWRDRLIAEGAPAITVFIEQHPNIDVQQLRQLTRNAQREKEAGRSTASARKLFRLLRDAELN